MALRLKQHNPEASVVAFDNLKRRGSELVLPRLRQHGIDFVHGDVRVREDLLSLGKVDLLLDCAAEPSVLAGVGGSPDYVIQTNLVGTINCLELARLQGADVVFLSTSRVYPIDRVNALAYSETDTRFTMDPAQQTTGASEHGIAEDFPLEGPRSLYGASKLCSELLLTEYVESYGIRAIVNRCGVLTGPWQMGKVDQGVVVLWAAKHVYRNSLSYIGYGGTGKQVRDILHVDDLFELLRVQLEMFDELSGETFNVGGGVPISVSLKELTELCRRFSGNSVEISAVAENRPNDLICYLSDRRRVEARTGWRPRREPAAILEEITRWIVDNKSLLEPILA